MKGLTIKEPWATLIIEGYKKYEFRSWKTKYRGKILIHAGATLEKDMVPRFSCYDLKYNCGYSLCFYVTTQYFKSQYIKKGVIYEYWREHQTN